MQDHNYDGEQHQAETEELEEALVHKRPSIASYGLDDLCTPLDMSDFDFEDEETPVTIRKPKRDEWFQVHPDSSQRLNAFFIEVESGLEKVNYLLTTDIAKRVMHSDLIDDIKRKYLVPCINLDNDIFLWGMGLPLRPGIEVNRFTKRYISFLPDLERRWCRVVWPKDASGNDAIHRLKQSKDFDDLKPAWPETISVFEMLKTAVAESLIDDWSHPVLKRLRGEV